MRRASLICRILFIIACVVGVIKGNHPPAIAQGPTAYENAVRNAVDAEDQKKSVESIGERMSAVEAKQAKIWDSLNEIKLVLAGMDGKYKGIFGFLGFFQLIGVGITIQMSRKKKEAA